MANTKWMFNRLVLGILWIHAILLFTIIVQRYGENISAVFTSESIAKQNSGVSLEISSHNRHINSILTEYRIDLQMKLDELITQNVSSNDPNLVSLIRQMLDPPSQHIIKTVRAIVEMPQSVEVMRLLRGKRGGFFVEVGGLDGERSSNTLHLEQRRKWNGLLIEMDPYFYTQLRGKNRRCWSINACVSPRPHPAMMLYKESSGGAGSLVDSLNTTENTKHVPCFPLESMLLALNRTHVDYLSLDVEGFEFEVLQTIPFDRVDIKVISVEYVHGKHSKTDIRKLMEKQGYKVHKDIHHHDHKIALFVDDYIFIKT